MPKFAANLSLMFTDLPFLDRFAAAADAGFDTVEFLFPYAWPAADIAARLEAHSLTLALFNLRPGDWDAGDRGLTAVTGQSQAFNAALAEALGYAKALGCRHLHAMAGLESQGTDAATYRQNLKHAAIAAAEHGITILIEPINTHDMPGYHLTRTRDALETIAAVDEPGLALQFDMYHCHRMGGDVLADMALAQAHIRHIQIAGSPGRHEPDTGTLDYAPIFAAIDASGFTGCVGCEYHPAGDTRAGLGWRDRLARPQA